MKADGIDGKVELTIKGMVKAEPRMELFDKKLEQSFKDQKEFNQDQPKINQHFLKRIEQSEKLIERGHQAE